MELRTSDPDLSQIFIFKTNVFFLEIFVSLARHASELLPTQACIAIFVSQNVAKIYRKPNVQYSKSRSNEKKEKN